jgi:cyclopropane fatty-acyl-phospholipid synthase-like methyltransferase
MRSDFEDVMAASLEVRPELLPHIPYLLQDLWALGGFPEIIVETLRSLPLPVGQARVLDLGCGKGGIAVPVAKELGFKIDGVDGFPPFLREAEEKAREYGVTDLCRFEFGDLRETVKIRSGYDVVIYSAVGNALGTLDACVGALRETVHPGGYILWDDMYLDEGASIDRRGYEHAVSHDETLRLITSHGDRLIREIVFSSVRMKEMNDFNNACLQKRAAELMEAHPELKNLLEEYLENQLVECDILENQTVGAMWVIQKKVGSRQ